MSKQRLLFITTGGTIASVRTAQGLKPVLTSEELLAHLPELQQLCCPETLNLCSIDSTDLGPEHWLMMAKAVQENYALYDGFIICHGTDTLAYSAAALSYLIQNADKPIILTGAQQPISNEITDAKKNLRDSVICALDPGSRGVMVVFGAGAGRPAGTVCGFALAYRPGGVWPGAEPKSVPAQADPRPWAGAYPGHLSTI